MNQFLKVLNCKQMFLLASRNQATYSLELSAFIFFILNEVRWLPESDRGSSGFYFSQELTQVGCLVIGILVCGLLLKRNQKCNPIRIIILTYLPAKIYAYFGFAIYHFLMIPIVTKESYAHGIDYGSYSNSFGFVLMYLITFGVIALLASKNVGGQKSA